MPRAKTPPKPAAKRAPPAVPINAAGRPKYLPRGMIWCGPCKALASDEGAEKTPHGFAFCAAHRSKK